MKNMSISIVIALMLIIPVSGSASSIIVSGRPYLGKIKLQGTELFWTDGSNTPLNKISTSGGPTTLLANRAVMPVSLNFQGNHFYWVDGEGLSRILKRTSLDEKLTEELLQYFVNVFPTDAVILDDSHIYFVSGTQSPNIFYLNMVPVAGGTPVVLASSYWTPIRTLARDATHIYWLEDLFPDHPSYIKRMTLGGGEVETVYESATSMITHFAILGSFIYFADIHYPSPNTFNVMKIPVSGGTTTILAEGLLASPKKFAASGAYLYWIDTSEALKRMAIDAGDITTMAESNVWFSDVLLATDYAFLIETECGTLGQPGCVIKVPLDGGPAEVFADNIVAPSRLALYATELYWVEGFGGGYSNEIGGFLRIAKAPITGGSVSTFLTGIGSKSASFAVDFNNIYIADGWNIKLVSRDGSVTERIAEAYEDVNDITTDGVNVYWIEKYLGQVKKVPVSGGPITWLGGGAGIAGPIHVVDNFVYWMDNYDAIKKVSINGGSTTVIASGLPFLSDMTVDGTNVYFSENDTGRIQKVPVNGGDITTLAYGSVYWMPYILAFDSDFVYWINAVEVGKVSKDGGNPATLHYNVLSDFDYPNSIVVDGANGAVYWTEVGGGTINKGSTEPVPPVNPTPCKVKVAKAKKNHGDGVVMSHDEYINCGPSCSVTYQSERVITFTATANEGSTFIGWNPASPNCSGTDPCSINLRGNTTTKIKAIFVGDYVLKVISQGKKGGNGTVTSITSSIHCITGSTAGCEAPYGYSEEVTLTASADIGSTFLGWKPSKLCPGTGDCTVTMDRKRTIKAVFSGQ